MRRDDWLLQLERVTAEAQARRFEWGTFDCCTFAFEVAHRLTGRHPMPGLLGSYSGKRGALEYLRARGYPDLATGFDDVLGPRKRPMMAQRGDIVMVGKRALGVVNRTGTCVLCISDESRIGALPLRDAIHAWTVG